MAAFAAVFAAAPAPASIPRPAPTAAALLLPSAPIPTPENRETPPRKIASWVLEDKQPERARWFVLYLVETQRGKCLLAVELAPEVGEWLSRDPLGEQGGLNLTAFCANDPVNKVDPFGLTNEPGDFGWDWFTTFIPQPEPPPLPPLPPVPAQPKCWIQNARSSGRPADAPVMHDWKREKVEYFQQCNALVPSAWRGTSTANELMEIQSEAILCAFGEPALAYGFGKLGQFCRIGRLMVGTERLSLAQARQIEFLSQHLKSAPLTGLGPGVAYDGSLYRIVREGYDPLVIHPGNIAASHRYTPSGYGGLYFSSGRRIAESEILGNAGTLTGTRLYSYDRKLFNLLDLTDPQVRASLGVRLDDLTRIGGTKAWRYEITQPLGVWAKEQGYSGIIAPAAQADGGVSVIIFDTGPLP